GSPEHLLLICLPPICDGFRSTLFAHCFCFGYLLSAKQVFSLDDSGDQRASVPPPSELGAYRGAHLPNAESCLRLIRMPTIERHEAWVEDHRYLNIGLLKGHKKEVRRPGVIQSLELVQRALT